MEPTPQTVVPETVQDTVPIKRIKLPSDLPFWESSIAYNRLFQTLHILNDSIKKMEFDSPKIKITPHITEMVNQLGRLSVFIDEIPPVNLEKSRYGNISFRTWHQRIEKYSLETLHKALLPEEFHSLIPEFHGYLMDAFGSPVRIDYGSGHELHFFCWIVLFVTIGVIKEEEYPAVILVVFRKYLYLCRKLQQVYRLEPAGSHGVWGIDDYQFLPFLFGSAQLIKHPFLKPDSILDKSLVNLYQNNDFYFDCIAYIYKVKNRAPFFESSPDLFNISAAESWEKINKGMFTKYHAEVLDKFPIVQHFLFGKILPFEQPKREEPSK
ncbi:serine/threonine protein phosphatase 2A regulatory subunit B', putative [Entamoeba invadens IP1]|uniref:Serine/threonine-protein phosphatase 2A activator n=1 Tax=Entamoeba invadens TaxID=33085 RepID=S0B161_ENTIV|nr:serine/threonine protein phosphatase 2A regulatory subunit B', putative [Entamoeba invadens IP1]ELP93343.1 serine/threonine protein phosphatase 2A regulatory subunit B', putative [Entamoeba invadens IP1]BAN40256.1 serine/threonine protein phosphatase 2A regulatory subunit B', putative [Entamoeba invadens]|eukprot:XP_004260114.1 serine/threonine protein phosphatase 2A regulatory subunit B', putative [Entamoeba invadens IP1]